MDTDTTYTGQACIDCIMLIANGDTSGNINCQTAEDEAAWLAEFERINEGIYWSVGDDEDHFSWTPCTTCHSPLGGTRMEIFGTAI
jgi:hypothetical protein